MRYLLIATLALAVGCGDDASPGGGAAGDAGPTTDGSTSDGTTSDAGAGCASDDQCAAPTPFCEGGACVACRAGAVGCPCADGGACTTGECVGGTCTDCRKGEAGCVCRANGTCADGQRCADGLCVACTPGLQGCPCDSGACGGGLACQAGTCVPDTCTAGMQDCPCDGGACGAGLYCDDATVCRACTPDVVGCPCAPGNTCDGDLRCDNGTCAACPDTAKPEGCGCADPGDCAAGLACDDLTHACRPARGCADACLPHQLCDTSVPGDAVCIPETCEDGYAWDGMACTAVVLDTCDGRDGSHDVSADCAAQQQACVEDATGAHCVDTCVQVGPACADAKRACEPPAAGADAHCGACLPGYTAANDQDPCMPDPQANCVPDAPQSLIDVCAGQRRLCVDTDTGAVCGDCLQGYSADPVTGECIAGKPCAGRPCADDEYCAYPQDGGAPRCVAVPCPAGQAADGNGACMPCGAPCADGVFPELIDGQCACTGQVFCDFQFDGAHARCHLGGCPDGQSRSPGGECVPCATLCGDDAGETARIWPSLAADGTCLCETQPGWYTPLGGDNRPRQCDADGDGWINRTAQATLQIRDGAVQANFRCENRQVDRFVLQNEEGQRLNVSLCDGRLVSWDPNGDAPCAEPEVIGLFEPDVLDSDGPIHADDAQFPAYRRDKPLAAQLDPLTKACVSATADYNDDNVEDISEEQPITPERLHGAPLSSADFAFRSLSYFVELHTAHFEPGAPGRPGKYVIAERSRCDQAFPLGYPDGSYWRSCTRDRDPRFDRNGSLVGEDFAWWSCDAASGSCPTPPPLVDAPPADADGDRIPDHGLCELRGDHSDGAWRGMSHHSQFRCAVLKDVPTQPWEVALSGLQNDDPRDVPQRFQFNLCGMGPCDGSASCRVGEGVQPQNPFVGCAPVPRRVLAVDQVGFVAVRYSPVGDYFGGCISEGAEPEYAAMCVGRAGGDVPASDADFGKLKCNQCGADRQALCDDMNVCTADGCNDDGSCFHVNACPPEGCPYELRQCVDPNGHKQPHLLNSLFVYHPQFDGDGQGNYVDIIMISTYPYQPVPSGAFIPAGLNMTGFQLIASDCPRADGIDCRTQYHVNFAPNGSCSIAGHWSIRFDWGCAPGADCNVIDPAQAGPDFELDFENSVGNVIFNCP